MLPAPNARAAGSPAAGFRTAVQTRTLHSIGAAPPRQVARPHGSAVLLSGVPMENRVQAMEANLGEHSAVPQACLLLST